MFLFLLGKIHVELLIHMLGDIYLLKSVQKHFSETKRFICLLCLPSEEAM
jgi:hypothetical protein